VGIPIQHMTVYWYRYSWQSYQGSGKPEQTVKKWFTQWCDPYNIFVWGKEYIPCIFRKGYWSVVYPCILPECDWIPLHWNPILFQCSLPWYDHQGNVWLVLPWVWWVFLSLSKTLEPSWCTSSWMVLIKKNLWGSKSSSLSDTCPFATLRSTSVWQV